MIYMCTRQALFFIHKVRVIIDRLVTPRKNARELQPQLKWKPSSISSSRACHGGDAHDRLEGGTGCGQPPTLHTAMYTGGMAYQVGEKQFK